MIYGIGTDIVAYPRIAESWERFGWRFAAKLLSEGELLELRQHKQPARMLAKRFAAKEALAKAVGSGLRAPVTMPNISVLHDGLGKPVFQFAPELRQYLAQSGISGHHLSISDEREQVVAFVVLESL